MTRPVPYTKDLPCEECGRLGCYDFMGDFLCERCCVNAENYSKKESYWEFFEEENESLQETPQ